MGASLIMPPGGSSVTVPVPARPSLVRNGGFWFAQCQDPATLTACGSTTRRRIGPDGWGVTDENADVQYQRVDTSSAAESGFGGRYYGTFKKITNAGKYTLTQVIESVDVQRVRGSTVRLQVRLKASANATWRVGLLQLTSSGTVDDVPGLASGTWISAWNADSTDPTLQAGNNVSYIAPDATNTENCTANGNALDCAVTTAWQRFGGTFAVPTDCQNLIVALWSDADITVNDTLSIVEVSLTEGVDVVQWAPLAYVEELHRCRRFIQKTFLPDTNPAQNTGVTTGALRGYVGKDGATAGAIIFHWRFEVPMLFTNLNDVSGFPSARGITRYNPLAANSVVRNVTRSTDSSNNSASQIQTSVTLIATGPAGSGGSASKIGDEAAIHMLVFAEL
jgi:hypothetical protein